MARITRALNDMQIPCPSAADPRRNAHRSNPVWTLTTVRTILANPRLGHRQVQRWNLPGSGPRTSTCARTTSCRTCQPRTFS
ncbi:recombinase family protein [Actinomadura latina]|uniref:recombinase family protein n=1 Tax=Actinomadura latina TaxID=163603 RepID=UPI00350E52B2